MARPRIQRPRYVKVTPKVRDLRTPIREKYNPSKAEQLAQALFGEPVLTF